MLVFEIRVPAFERPEMLRRAVESLLSQTYPHWRAIVYDDSRLSSAQETIKSLRSTQIVYKRNPVRLGAAQNIDQCFSPHREFDGTYGCILEDDNYWLPDFLASIVGAISTNECDLIMANQRIHEQGIGLRSPDETTRGLWFQHGVVPPVELRASLLYMEGVSNGGLVWKLNDKIDLRVGVTVRETGLQEACRSLLIDRPFLFLSAANAAWNLMPKADTARSQESNRTISRGMQSIRDFVLVSHGPKVVEIARSWAEKLGLIDRLIEALCYSGHPLLARDLLRNRRKRAFKSVAKGWAIRACESDPCSAFLSSLSPALPSQYVTS